MSAESSRNFLAVTPAERKKLRDAKIRLKEIHLHNIKEIQALLQVSKLRAMELYALSEFQSLPHIGIRFAYDLISLGYYNLNQLKGKDGAKLIDQFEQQIGAWADPCLEDQFRLIVHYAKHPDSHKNWWDFTPERKAFRETHGYPANRPKKPWFELPEFHIQNNLPAKKQSTKEDVKSKLAKAVKLMKKDFSEKITLKQLANESHLSQYHFLRCFQSAYTKTPLQYLTHLRLKKACTLLRKTEQPIATIIGECGFQNESSFIRLFKREFKVTPIAFRNEFSR